MSQGKLRIRASRRQLFTDLRETARALDADRAGRPALRLSDLGTMPPDELRAITPTIVAGSRIEVEADKVMIRQDGPVPAASFGIHSLETNIFNLFNGYTSIGEASLAFAKAMDWQEERAFQAVRGVFLELVAGRVCVPA